MHKNIVTIAAISMALTVALGAFSAHALREVLDERLLKIFNTAVEYQLYHSLGLLLIGNLLMSHRDNLFLKRAAYTMLIGMVVFSGSLYLIVVTGINKLGMITPIGGVLMIIAWLLLAWSQYRQD